MSLNYTLKCNMFYGMVWAEQSIPWLGPTVGLIEQHTPMWTD